MTLRVAVGGLVSIIGVSLIILGGGDGLDLSSEYMVGNLLALSISLIGALFNLACMPLMNKYSPLKVTTWYMLFGTLFLFPFTLSGWESVELSSLSFITWGAIAYNVVLCTVAAFVIWNVSMKKVGATKSNFYRYFVPASAAVAGALFFNEAIFMPQIIGALIIVLGLAWISSERKPSAVPAGKNKIAG